MNSRSVAVLAVIIVAVFAGLIPATAQAPAPATAKTPTAKMKSWTVPRTPDGHPDLQGTWTNGTITPLERPDGARLALTKEEAERLEKVSRIASSVSMRRAIRTGRRRQRAETDRPARQATSAATTTSGWNLATASRS